MDSLHMFCALFGRALLPVEWIGMKNGTIEKINQWFEENRILCILGNERVQIKVIGKEVRRFLERRESLFKIINNSPKNDEELSKTISSTVQLFEVRQYSAV